MFILYYFLKAIANVIHYGLNAYMVIVIVQALLSWVNPDPYNPIVRFLSQATEPLYYQIRKRIPTVFGGLDISPIIVLLALSFLDQFLVNVLFGFAAMIYH